VTETELYVNLVSDWGRGRKKQQAKEAKDAGNLKIIKKTTCQGTTRKKTTIRVQKGEKEKDAKRRLPSGG